MKNIYLGFFAVFLVTGCGQELPSEEELAAAAAASTSQSQKSTSLVVASEAELPTCDASRAGQLVYIEAEEVFKTCKADAWTEIQVKTKEPLLRGSVSCSRVSTEFWTVVLTYSVNIFTSGDIFVNCSVRDSYNQYSNSVLYSKYQTGGTTARCSVGYDFDDRSVGGVDFTTTQDFVASAVYSDSGSTYDGTSMGFSSSDCTITDFITGVSN